MWCKLFNRGLILFALDSVALYNFDLQVRPQRCQMKSKRISKYHSELLLENECKKISLSTLPQFPLFYLHFYIPSASVYIMLLSGCFLLTYLPLMQKCDKRGGGGGLVGIRGSSLEDDEDVFEEPGHHHRRSRQGH